MQALVTGGAGFIGSQLAIVLSSQGAAVTVLDNLSTGSLANIGNAPLTFIQGDIGDMDVVQAAAAGCDVIFHQAALVSVPQSIEHPVLNHQTNVTGTFNVFEAARQQGVRRVVYASSSAVYGNLPQLPKREDSELDPISPYAAAKATNETLAHAYQRTYGLEMIGLRYMNVYGPGQQPASPYSGVLSLFCQAALTDGRCTIYGDGEQTRDFVYVSDVVQANLHAARAAAVRLPDKTVFNIGLGRQTSLNQIIGMLEELTQRRLDIAYAEERPGDIKHSVANIQRAQSILSYHPQMTVIDGLDATLAWFRDFGLADPS